MSDGRDLIAELGFEKHAKTGETFFRCDIGVGISLLMMVLVPVLGGFYQISALGIPQSQCL